MKKIILVGEAGCGKTYLAETFERHGYKANLSVTTRPMRDGEEHMKHYNFMSWIRFMWNKLLGRFWEVKKFNGWYYGTLKSEWRDKDLFIFTPGGVEGMSDEDIANSVILYINVPEEVRRSRLMERSDADSVERRIDADRRDFESNRKYKNELVLYSPDGMFNAIWQMKFLLETAGEDQDVIKLFGE